MANQAPIVDRIRIIPRPDDFLDRNVGSSGEVFFDQQSNTLRLYSGKVTGGFTVLTSENLQSQLFDSGVSVVEYTVTVGTDPDEIESGNKYFINGTYKPELTFVIGYTYIFNQNDPTNEYFPNPTGGAVNTHALNFSSDNANGTLGGGTSYTTNVLYKLDNDVVTQQEYWDRFANATQRSIQITVTSATPTTLYYWCQQHTGMGNTITVAEPGTGTGSGGASVSISETAPENPEVGSIWFNSNNGKLYVYISDVDSNQWVQPTTPFPSSITDLGITDGTTGQVLTTDGAGTFTFETVAGGDIGNFSLAASTITTDDSSGITIVPAVTMNSDLTVENDLTVNNNAYAGNFVSTGIGLPEIQSPSTLTLSAPDGVIVQNGPFRLPSFTTAQKNAIVAVNGDMVYDTTLNKAQVYENGSWTSLV